MTSSEVEAKVDLSIRVSVYRMFTHDQKLVAEDSKQEKIELPLFSDSVPRATVSTDMSLTKNLGNYNSAKVSVFCSVPCYLEEQEMKNAMAFAKKFCEDTITPNMEEFVEFVKENHPEVIVKLGK